MEDRCWRSGTSSGFGTTSELSHEWVFVLDDRFLRLSTRSVSRREDGSEEMHEDVGYVSRDTDRNTFVFRQFLSEGFVNAYDVVVSGDEATTVDFLSREAESAGGMRAQMQLRFSGPDEYGMVLELASPGEDFVACQEMSLRRSD